MLECDKSPDIKPTATLRRFLTASYFFILITASGARATNAQTFLRMKLIISLLVSLSLVGCTASVVTTTTTYPMNHFQSGRTIGIDSLKPAEVGVSIGMARTMRTTVFRDSAGNKSAFYNDTRTVVAGGMMQFAITENFDLGGDATIAVLNLDDRNFAEEGIGRIGGGMAFRVFGKYELLPKSSKVGVALLPLVGYAIGGSGESSDIRINQNQPAKATASSGGFTVEIATPISFHPNNTVALTLTPIYYALNQNINYTFTPENSGAEEKQSFNRRFSNFGLGIGIHAKNLRAEVTLVENLRGSIIPFFGLMLAL